MEERYMRRAIGLARLGEGKTSPNPLVGAVIAKDGAIIGEGYHEQFGGPHAERNALKAAAARAAEQGKESMPELLRGAELYVTLEPCCHHGKTPPCTEAIIESGIRSVIVGSADPNPKVSGKGILTLRQAGIKVTEAFLKEECDRLNPVFFHYIRTGLPYVALKYAMTADGKIAAVTGKSKWITGEEARSDVQRLRNKYAGIMAGIGTVLADDPLLTCRMSGGRQPVRIICDSYLRLPPESQICKTAGEIPTIAAALAQSEWRSGDIGQYRQRRQCLESKGIQILELPPTGGKAMAGVDMRALMKQLAVLEIDSILVEGGAELNYSLLESGLVSKLYAYIAPKLLGGAQAKSPVGGCGVDGPEEAFFLSGPEIRRIGDDIMLEYEVVQGREREKGR